MKKLWLSILLSAQLLAFDTETAAKIFDKIFTAMYIQKPIAVYTVSEKYQDVVVTATSLQLSKNPKLADIVLVDSKYEIPKEGNHIIFTTDPSVFKRNENAVGAFYWEHGRPKIIFLQSRLKTKGITITNAFQRYIVREIP